MKKIVQALISLGLNILVLAILFGLLRNQSFPDFFWAPAFLFGILILFTMTWAVRLGGGLASLMPMTAVAAYLALGLGPSTWLVYLSSWLHALIRYYFAAWLEIPRPPSQSEFIHLSATNAFMHTASLLVGGLVFEAVGGIVPLVPVDFVYFRPLLALLVTYFIVNHLLAALYFHSMGQKHLYFYLRELPRLLVYEAPLVLFAPFVALTYTQLGWSYFVFVVVGLILITRVIHNLDWVRRRLEQRVTELDSLQAVGQALSSSLDLETILYAVYAQVVRLMPASTFYVALHDARSDEVSFPLNIEEGQLKQAPARRAANGLTEYVLRTRRPLLVRNLNGVQTSLGLEHYGPKAYSWLGVPILAADDLLGVIAVQSLTEPAVYDERHQEMLVTIASQAALAIQNARLYSHTDTTLALRVQELDSILRTTHNGILLLDGNWRVLATNPALLEFAGLESTALGVSQATRCPAEAGSLLERLSYSLAELEADCAALLLGEKLRKRQIVLPGYPVRYVERTLTAVYDRNQAIVGWLLSLHEVTEEVELARLRDDMTHMLVHDLRSPLSVLMGSLETSRLWLETGKAEDLTRLLELAEASSKRMLRLINDLLDMYKFESGQTPLYPTTLPADLLLMETASQFTSLAAEAAIMVDIQIEPDLPPLLVDANYMSRVLYNLLDNAFKFTPNEGKIYLWARLDSGRETPMVQMGVSDTGPGIPPELHGRLFKKFQQGVTKGGRRRGTGLGLPYCKLVVEAHGGQIWIESEGKAGQGSTFVMRLPAVIGK